MAEHRLKFTVSRRAKLVYGLLWVLHGVIDTSIVSSQTANGFFLILPGLIVKGLLMGICGIAVWRVSVPQLYGKHWITQTLGHLLGACLYTIAALGGFLLLFYLLLGEATYREAMFHENWMYMSINYFSMYGVLTGIFYFNHAQALARENEKRESELRLRTKQMELAVLKAQLNPHFLFNTLNAINALIGSNPTAARTVLVKLSDVLRYALESDRTDFVSLREELDFTETYLSIEKARLGERLETEFQISPEAYAALIPPMLLQPLVENAVKHGIAPKATGGQIQVRAETNGKQLQITVTDTGLGSHAAAQTAGSGVGLQNTNTRLQKLFGERSALNIKSAADGFTVSFVIPMLELAPRVVAEEVEMR
jgi:two-component system, LytTR family, sensor kinase